MYMWTWPSVVAFNDQLQTLQIPAEAIYWSDSQTFGMYRSNT